MPVGTPVFLTYTLAIGKKLIEAIGEVISSYGENYNFFDQVLIQEFISDVVMAGVVFTCILDTGAPYYRFNFDDKTNSTESVTSGSDTETRTIIVNRTQTHYLADVASELMPVLKAVIELEELLGFDRLDIEFAIDRSSKVHIFQVRPILVNKDFFDVDVSQLSEYLENAKRRYFELQSPPPQCFNVPTIAANMPDWNPAEIIGVRPKPLALSLYQELITDRVWAQQRFEFVTVTYVLIL